MTTLDTERRAMPPREQVLRMTRGPIRAADPTGDDQGDGLTLDGYAAVFNRATIIDSWEGRFKEQLSPGSMKKSFRENPPKVQFDHGTHPLLGSIPIGSVRSVVEDSDPVRAPEGGAHVIARLHDNWLVQPIRDAIESESVDGMSFRFTVVSEQWHDAAGKRITDPAVLQELLYRSWREDVPDDELLLRTLKEVKVPELGPVVFPAYSDTSVGVRSKVTIDLGRLQDPDQRNQLARAVFMADAAGRTTQAPDAPPVTETADEHAPGTDGTPRSTDTTSAGEHESTSTTDKRQQAREELRQWANHARRTVLTIKEN